MKIFVINFFLMIALASAGFGQTYYQSGGTNSLSNQTYTATANDASGVVVTLGGVFTLATSKVITSGNTTNNDSSSFYGLNAGVLAKKASTITLNGCKISTSGTGANGAFATDTLSSVILNGDTIQCTKDGAYGVDATFGASLTLTNCIINTAGAHGAAISTDRGGGTIHVTADNISTLTLTLQNASFLSGAINNANSAKSVSLAIDAGSSWNVTADSYVPLISDPTGISGSSILNITGNGHTVTYDGTLSANSYLNERTYSLQNGGVLTCPTCTPLGIDETNVSLAGISCYPVPCANVLTVSTGSFQPQLLRIYTLVGEKKLEKNLSGTGTIDVTTWGNGIYFLLIGDKTVRVIVSH
jgi:hypothetical protein